jgi:hypothetical protein
MNKQSFWARIYVGFLLFCYLANLSFSVLFPFSMNTFLVSDALSEANSESKEREKETSFESESCVSTTTDENHVASHKGDSLLLFYLLFMHE